MLDKVIMAIVAAIIADTVVKKKSGKHIHQHVLAWWNRVRDYIVNWAHMHGYTYAINVVLLVDKIMVGMARLTIKAHPKNDSRDQVITTEKLSWDEVIRQFPALRSSRKISVKVPC